MTAEQDEVEAGRRLRAGECEELRNRLAANEAAVAALEWQMAAVEGRANHANQQASDSDTRAQSDRDRIGTLEGPVDVHALLIAELQAEGLVGAEREANLELALRSSRTIGAAIGIVMVKADVREFEAFQILRKVSMDRNKKLRDLADEVLLTGELNLQDR